MRLKYLKAPAAISSPGRIPSIDIFRSVAIISVVLFHFNATLPFGYLGVDLFFVISGFLIGGILTRQFEKQKRIHYLKFILQRGLKIWPSYYVFLFIGLLLATFLYRNISPGMIIPLWDLKRYLFFYQNYTGMPYHWCFDHVWSICVEEHFYLLLPILFIIAGLFRKTKLFFFVSTALIIVLGVAFKYLSLTYTHSMDTYSATHVRIDALAWGVLLNLIIFHFDDKLKSKILRWSSFFTGLVLFALAVYIEMHPHSFFYEKIFLHSFTPFFFFLMLFGLYHVKFSGFKILRIISYYSYNWYLWHPLFVIYITFHFGNTPLGLSIYLITSFIFAFIFSTLVEETVLSKRGAIIKKIFGDREGLA